MKPILNEDLLATVGTLFGIEHDLQDEYEDLGKTEKKLLYDIGELLEKLYKWIALSSPSAPPYDRPPRLRAIIFDKGVDEICQQYPEEIECWSESNQQKIDNVVRRALAWKFPD